MKKENRMKAFRSAQHSVKIMAAIGCLFLASCASNQEQIYVGDIKVDDRFESSNRMVFAFNDTVNDAVIHPVVKGYRMAVPSPARTGLRNVLRTLRAPVNLGNQVLQGDVEGAGNVVTRTIINVLVGVGGIFDVAGYEGMEYESEDFGQTLAVWGVDHGPYLVLPLIGPPLCVIIPVIWWMVLPIRCAGICSISRKRASIIPRSVWIILICVSP